MFAHTGPYGLAYGTQGDLLEGSTVSISPLIGLLRMLSDSQGDSTGDEVMMSTIALY